MKNLSHLLYFQRVVSEGYTYSCIPQLIGSSVLILLLQILFMRVIKSYNIPVLASS
jgi:hypothetical protein